MTTTELFLRDVIEIQEDVHSGDFKVELAGGFTETEARVAEYVVTDQLKKAFARALNLVRAAVRNGNSYAAYLHGSFGSGKSHFLTVLHAVLNNEPAARAKPRLQEVIADHDDWLRGKRFLMVPYHLVGSTDLDSALLGGYVAMVRKLHPQAPTPAVYRADAMLADATRLRASIGDDAFVKLLPGAGTRSAVDDDPEDLEVIGGSGAEWTGAELDRAFAAPAGSPDRDRLVSALLSGPMSAYAEGARGDAEAFLPLENGLAVISRHAKSLGYDGIVLFLDELILWLQAHLSDREMVNSEVSKLVKLIESGDSERPVPIVSFISRQRDLSQLVGSDVVGEDVKNLETQVSYLAERFDVVSVEDRNLPEIIKARILTPKDDQAKAALDAAFASVDSTNPQVKDVLLDANGATHADWSDFRSLYPLSPALLNVLVALSGALQRERTGLKLLQEMLRRRRADFKLGELIPLGDLWDVLSDGTGEAFTDRLRSEAEAAHRFYNKVRAYLTEKYGSPQDPRFVAVDRSVKTLLLSALAPDVPALTRLTGGRIAALNHGSIRSRVGTAGSMVVNWLRELQAEFGEIRSDGEVDPVFTLHLSDLDIEPLLDAVAEEDRVGARRIWIKDQLWKALGVQDDGQIRSEREIVWRGTRRTAEFVFGKVRLDAGQLREEHFEPSLDGRVLFVLDYPFDEDRKYPSDALLRIEALRQAGVTAPTVVWLPSHFSDQKKAQLGRLMKINYLLERDRLNDYAVHLSADDRIRVRHQLSAQRDNLTSQLTATLAQVYGIAKADEGSISVEVVDGVHVHSLFPEFRRPQVQGGKSFRDNLAHLADGVLRALYPNHPDFDRAGDGKPVTLQELRTARVWIGRAMEDGSRRVEVDSHHLKTVKKIVEPLELGQVHDGPLVLRNDWRVRINQLASRHQVGSEFTVEDVRRWIAEELGWTGLDRHVSNLVIATYALLDDRAWTYHSSVLPDAPELERIGAGYGLRAQELPSQEEYTAARERAARIFGVSAQPTLFARNVHKLFAGIQAKAEEYEHAVNGVRSSLHRHAAALGLAPDTGSRASSQRDAADLLARLARHRDATALVRELAALSYQTSDQVLGTAITSAPEVLQALDDTEWQLLESVRGFTGRQDRVGEQAERLLGEVAQAAAASEFERSILPVLAGIRKQAIAIVQDAARLARAAEPVAPAAPPASPQPTPDDVSLDDGAPAVPAQPAAPADPPPTAPSGPARAPAARTVRLDSSRLENELNSLWEDISAYSQAHPGIDLEISYRVLHDAAPAGEQIPEKQE